MIFNITREITWKIVLLIKVNNLKLFYNILSILGIFPATITDFFYEFCNAPIQNI